MALQSSDVNAGDDALNTDYNKLRADVLGTHHREVGASPIDSADIATSKRLLNLIAQTFTGLKTFASIPLLPAVNPTLDNEAARKKYVDDNKVVTEIFTADGTFNKPAGVSVIQVVCISGGGAGAGGSKNVSQFSFGRSGTGGGGGAAVTKIFKASDVPSSVAVIVGAGGVGGVGIGPDAFNNNPGTDGGDTLFGDLVTAIGGFRGTSTAGLGGHNQTGTQTADAIAGKGSRGNAEFGGGGGESDNKGGSSIFGGGGGSQGGSLTLHNGFGAGREGGQHNSYVSGGGGAGGASNAANGSDGNDGIVGDGGGSGATSNNSKAGNGGNGGTPGGGGAGGGLMTNFNFAVTGGDGGDGGRGEVRIFMW